MANDILDKPDMRHYDIDKEVYVKGVEGEYKRLVKQLNGEWVVEVEPQQTITTVFDTRIKGGPLI